MKTNHFSSAIIIILLMMPSCLLCLDYNTRYELANPVFSADKSFCESDPSISEALLLSEILQSASTKDSTSDSAPSTDNQLNTISRDNDVNREIKPNPGIRRQIDSLRAITSGVPVIIFKDTVFYIYSKLGAFSAVERAERMAQKVEMMVEEGQFTPEGILVVESEDSHDLQYENVILISVTDRDAYWLKKDRKDVAESYGVAIRESISSYQSRSGIWAILRRIGLVLLTLAIFFFGLKYMNKIFSKFNAWLLKKGNRYIKGVRFKNYEFLSQEREEQLLKWVLKILKWLIIALVVYMVLPILFSIFPATEGIAAKLLGYVLNPLKTFGIKLVGYIPELITVTVIILITRYFIRFLKFLSLEVEHGKLQIPGFYSDWAVPTFNLLRIITYAFAFVVIFPYIPGSDSPVFQGVSVFLGLLISLGSSSAIGNIIAGLVITYMRPFKIGDRVKIGEITGDVMEKTMLVTRLRTIKNEDITIPNSAILNGSTINYSSNAPTLGLILNTTITIGYDVPWRKVHELLIAAANQTEHIKKDPAPFVFQNSLDDFYVSYQINAYTDQSSIAASIYSNLHSNIQDAFNDAGVEIMSPHYRAARDGNFVTIPADYLPPDYHPPSFNVDLKKDTNQNLSP